MSQENSSKNPLLQQSFKMIKNPVIIAFFITPIRYSLELIGLPENLIFIIGLLWLTIGFAIYWAIKFHQNKQFIFLLILSLMLYSPISRIPVAIAWWIDRYWDLGTHYGLYFDNFSQAFLNQVVYGSIVQIIPGFVFGSITFAIMKHKRFSIRNNTIS